MKRNDRDSPLKVKRRSSIPRFDYRGMSPDSSRDRDRRKSSPKSHRLSHSKISSRVDDDYGRSRSFEKPAGYKIICVSNINHKVSDSTVRDTIMREFKKFDAVDTKIVHDGSERLAFVHFRTTEDARDARHAKSRMVLFDKAISLEPAYSDVNRGSSDGRTSRRNYDDPYPPPRIRGISPAHSNTSGSSLGRRPRHPSVERIHPHPLPIHHRDVPPFRREMVGPPDFRPQPIHIREEKKEKFPNYLHHIPPEEDDKATRTLFVGNLEVTIPEVELKRIFEHYGTVEDVDIKRPPPGLGNAYAFVKFVNLDMAHRAKVAMSGQYIGKFQCKIGYGKATPTTRIWVGGLGPWTSLSHLEKEFDRFGAIKKIDFVKGDNHAYILYDSIDAAQAACQEMRGFPLGGADRRLRVDFADTSPYSGFHQTPAGVPPYPGAPVARIPRRDDTAAPAADQRFYSTSEGREYAGKWQVSSSYPGGSHRYEPYGERPGHFAPREGEWAGRDSRPQSQYHWSREGWQNETGRGDWQANRKHPISPDLADGARAEGDGPPYKRQRSSSPDRSPRHRTPDSALHDKQLSPGRLRGKEDYDRGSSRNGMAVLQSATTLQDLVRCCPVMWHGGLVLKNSAFPTRMYIAGGSATLIDSFLKDPTATTPLLRITQRLRLEQSKLDDVSKRITSAGPHGHGILFGLPGTITISSTDSANPTQQRPLRNLVSYLKQKEAAGVIALTSDKEAGHESGVLYAFAPCPFSFDLLKQLAPNLTAEGLREDHLVIVICKGQV